MEKTKHTPSYCQQSSIGHIATLFSEPENMFHTKLSLSFNSGFAGGNFFSAGNWVVTLLCKQPRQKLSRWDNGGGIIRKYCCHFMFP